MESLARAVGLCIKHQCPLISAGAPTFVQLCQWASVTPGIGVVLDVPGVLRWVASKFPGVSPETLHSIFVLDEVRLVTLSLPIALTLHLIDYQRLYLWVDLLCFGSRVVRWF